MTAIIFWIAIAIIAVIVDLFTSAFLFCWLAVGSAGAIIANILGFSIFTQIVVFTILTIICIAIGYKVVRKKIKGGVRRLPLMEENYIGKTYIAEEDIIGSTRLKVEGSYWTGENEGEKILKGEKFVISGISGNKLIIKKC